MELSEKQEQIVRTNKRKVHVISAAASGKTTLIVERVRYLLSNNVPADKIVAITFTNNAANEMLERLGYPDGLFIGTVHSYCNYLLRSYAIDTTKYLNEENFDELFEIIKNNPQCVRPIEHLIVDEFQDSSAAQIEFFELLQPKNYMYCYDPRQAIYSFDNGDIDKVLLAQYEPNVTIYEMNENYRNGRNILYFAKNLLYNLDYKFHDNSIAKRDKDGYVKHTKWSYKNIVDYFLNEVDSDKFKDWFVLARKNQEINLLGEMFKKANIPYTSFKQGNLSKKEMEEEVNSNKIKLLTIHSAKGLESPNVLVVRAPSYYSKDEEKRVFYVAATRAKNLLIWNKMGKKETNTVETTNWE